MPGDPPMFQKRAMDAVREDVLCAYLVLCELNEYGQHYSAKARLEIVEKAVSALRNVWLDTGADPGEMDPKMVELMKVGQICRGRPKLAAG
jgi:hypothetical protein